MLKKRKIFGFGTVVMLFFLALTSVTIIQADKYPEIRTETITDYDIENQPVARGAALDVLLLGYHLLEMGPDLYEIVDKLIERDKMIDDLIDNGC